MSTREQGPRPQAEPVSEESLRYGEIYFSVQFLDEDLCVPILEPLIFLGRNLRSNDAGRLYFQSFDSYLEGVRYESAAEEQRLHFQIGTAENIKHIFEYEKALDVLMRCTWRRKEKGK